MHKYLKDNPSLQKVTLQTEKNNADTGRDDDDFRRCKTHSCSYERPMTDLSQIILSTHGRSLFSQELSRAFPSAKGVHLPFLKKSF